VGSIPSRPTIFTEMAAVLVVGAYGLYIVIQIIGIWYIVIRAGNRTDINAEAAYGEACAASNRTYCRCKYMQQ
jgi:hypothetical protein